MNAFPRRFGAYALAKPLARGGMGALYLALAEARERALPGSGICVIKTVLPHLADKEYVQRFRDEAKVVVRLSHQNLVPVFDSGEAGGELYLGMDFIDGRDLRAIWNRCAKKGVAFPIDVAVFMVRELARGLEYAHGCVDLKLVHRDVSPPNVLVAYDGQVKLTDFGLASSTLKLEKTIPGIIYGKVSYMSPEQSRCEQLDGRSDLFAAGIILWELLTGRQLFAPQPPPAPGGAGAADAQAAASEELLRRVRNPQINPPSRRASRVPAELDRIALRALAPRLEDRYPSCAAFADDLSAYLAATAPGVDRARVAGFLSELYGEDVAAERESRTKVLAEARELLRQPPKPVRRATPAAGLTVPVAVAADAAPAAAPAASPPPAPPRSPPPAPARRSSHRTKVESRHGDTVSVPIADSTASPGSPAGAGAAAGATGAVIGTVIGGRYRVRRLCGEGGMGRVYEAEHVDIEKRVALKILHPAYSQTPDLVERLRREARAASRIGHPNVVDVTDSGTTDDGSFFFVMEYLEGRELGEIIFREGGLDVQRALGIAVQVCRALQAAHTAGVIHRDLKPENVLIISRDGQKDFVKVLDFGIAKSVTEPDDDRSASGSGGTSNRLRRKLTSPGVAMGTPEYMAPEQAAGRPADARSDVYAVGGILYEMLSGKPAYEGSNFMEILHKKANERPTALASFRTDIPGEIEALVARTMAKDPAVRPQTMAALEELLLQALASGHFPAEARYRIPGSGGAWRPAVLGRIPIGYAAGWRSLAAHPRKLVGLGAAIVTLFALVGIGVARSRVQPAEMPGIGAAAEPVPSPAPTPLPALAAPPESPPEPAPATAPVVVGSNVDSPAAGEDAPVAAAAEAAADARPAAIAAAAAARAARAEAAAQKRELAEAQQLLHAQRFAEARAAFSRLTRSGPTRGPALLALAEIAFQEKNYEEAVRSARLAADRGGGARARVVLGDAHFRLSRYQEAVTAYEQALRLDPRNASARTGLALAGKRL